MAEPKPIAKYRYTVRELAELLGDSEMTIRRTLADNGIRLHKGHVLLVEFKRALPDVWQSLELARYLNER